MVQFLILTAPNKSKVRVNMAHIIAYIQSEDTTIISTSDGAVNPVEETCEQIDSLISLGIPLAGLENL